MTFTTQVFAALVSGGLITGIIALIMLPKQIRKLNAETDIMLSREAREWVMQARSEVTAALSRVENAETAANEAHRISRECWDRCARLEELLRARGIPVPQWPGSTPNPRKRPR